MRPNAICRATIFADRRLQWKSRMRLFTGLDLPPEVVESLERLLKKLRPTAHVQWSPPENLHITTKFIGEWPDEKLDELKTALAGVESRGPIQVHIRRVGFFPNPHS